MDDEEVLKESVLNFRLVIFFGWIDIIWSIFLIVVECKLRKLFFFLFICLVVLKLCVLYFLVVWIWLKIFKMMLSFLRILDFVFLYVIDIRFW